MNTFTHTTLAIFAFALFSASASAQQKSVTQPTFGNEGSGGGDACEMRVREIARDIRSWIVRGDADSLELDGVTSLERYKTGMLDHIGGSSKRNVKQAGINCTADTLKIGNVEKTCINRRSESGRGYITCNSVRFMRETKEEDQYRLIHHEFAAIAGFEASSGYEDSKYPLSDQLDAYLVDVTVKRLAVKQTTNIPSASDWLSGCAYGEVLMNNDCVPANVSFEKKCELAGGYRFPYLGKQFCKNEYYESLMIANSGQYNFPRINRLRMGPAEAAVMKRVRNRKIQYRVRAGDKLTLSGRGTYGKYPNCSERNFSGKNVSDGEQNYFPYNEISTQGDAEDREGFVASDGHKIYYLGEGKGSSSVSVTLTTDPAENGGSSGLYVGANYGQVSCANFHSEVSVYLEQCTDSAMQPVACP